MGSIEGVFLTPLKIIDVPNGNVLHALKQHENSFQGFGEAYFSTVKQGVAKGWKKHTRMVLNLIVPVGAIKFIIFDGRPESATYNRFMEVIISPDGNYQRLTVSPGLWMAFQGISEGLNMLLNIASIPHDPSEAENLPLQNDLITYSF